jgi:type II secretory pathway pseudopilin PulG
MGEFIDFLIIVIVIYYIAKALFRIFVPVLFENAVNKAQQQQQRQQQYRASDNQQQQYRTTNNQQQQYTRASTSQGKIKVDYVPPKTKKKGSIPDSEGDFIDYEEVK